MNHSLLEKEMFKFLEPFFNKRKRNMDDIILIKILRSYIEETRDFSKFLNSIEGLNQDTQEDITELANLWSKNNQELKRLTNIMELELIPRMIEE